jgi:succinate dehydrogenase / fumarate reductase membrane anchor subunit
MINATKKWIFLKLSGATLIPLMLWFILSLNAIYDQEYIDIVNFFTNSLSKVFIQYIYY